MTKNEVLMNLLHTYQLCNLPLKLAPLECIQHVSYMMKLHNSSSFLYIPTKTGTSFDSFIYNKNTNSILSKIEFKFKQNQMTLGKGNLDSLKIKYSHTDIVDLGFKFEDIFFEQKRILLTDYKPYNQNNPIIKATDYSD